MEQQKTIEKYVIGSYFQAKKTIDNIQDTQKVKNSKT